MGKQLVEIYTDGACKGNPGPGGWAAILSCRGTRKILTGGERLTTNNRMEMTAAVMALEALTRPCRVHITTDSQYLMKGMTSWLPNWKRRNWKTSQNTTVKNEDLWRRLEAAAGRHEVSWFWVRGHNSHEENEMADALARKALIDAATG